MDGPTGPVFDSLLRMLEVYSFCFRIPIQSNSRELSWEKRQLGGKDLEEIDLGVKL